MFNPILYFEYSLNNLNNGLVAYYNLNGNTNDITGKTPNGTQTNTTFVTGINGQCVNFANATARVDINDSDNLSFTTGGGNDVPFSISLWATFSAFSSGGTIGINGNWLINKRNTTAGGDEWQVALGEGQFGLTKFDRVSNTIYQQIKTPTNPFSLNTWYHLTVTDNGSKTVSGMSVYINSVKQTVVNTSSAGVYTGMPNGPSITRIGLNAWNLITPTIRHQGNIDEVAIWKNRELNQNEITELYNSGVGKFYPF